MLQCLDYVSGVCLRLVKCVSHTVAAFSFTNFGQTEKSIQLDKAC